MFLVSLIQEAVAYDLLEHYTLSYMKIEAEIDPDFKNDAENVPKLRLRDRYVPFFPSS